MADETTPDESEGVVLPFDTHEMSASQAIEAIKALEDPSQDVLTEIYLHEGSHPDYDGGRKTVLDALEERIGEGEVEDGGAPEDEDEAPAPGAPGSFVTATVGGQRHRAKVVEKVEAVVVELGDVHGTRALVHPDDWK